MTTTIDIVTPTTPPAAPAAGGVQPPAGASPAGTPPAGTPPEGQQTPAPAATPPGDAKLGGTPPTPPAAPAAPYKLAAPEGTTIDGGVLDEYTAAANELKLPADAAQQLLQRMAGKLAEQTQQRIASVQQGWEAESIAAFGDRLPEVTANARKVLALATDELRELLGSTGLQKHRAFLSLFDALGRRMSADVFQPAAGGPAAGPQTLAERMYPSLKT